MSRGNFEHLAMWSFTQIAFGNSFLAQQNLHTAGPLPFLSKSKSTQIFERGLTMAVESSTRSKQTVLLSGKNLARWAKGFAKLKLAKAIYQWIGFIVLDLPFETGFFCWQFTDEKQRIR